MDKKITLTYKDRSRMIGLEFLSRPMARFIKTLKPSNSKIWVPKTGLWWVKLAHLEVVIKQARKHFDEIDYSALPENLKKSVSKIGIEEIISEDPRARLYLSKNAPLVVVKAAYKALARIHHPDSGILPDPEMFMAINEAYEEIIAVMETSE